MGFVDRTVSLFYIKLHSSETLPVARVVFGHVLTPLDLAKVDHS